MTITITPERPDTADAAQLIAELDAYLMPLYPIESHHGYDVGKLLREGVAFFVIRHHDAAAGCGGIQIFGGAYGELKRMYVRPAFRGLGLAKRLLDHLSAYARERTIPLLRLETGIHQHEAIGLYERAGFRRIAPFPPYVDDPLSVFYEKALV
jgi:ribosomal protein S18 acetylase RimI-like enzyme